MRRTNEESKEELQPNLRLPDTPEAPKSSTDTPEQIQPLQLEHTQSSFSPLKGFENSLM
jgi:hypothetical protein